MAFRTFVVAGAVAVVLGAAIAFAAWDDGGAGSSSFRSVVPSLARDGGSSPVREGDWGGEHVSMQVTATGAKLEFDCAHGSIPSPIPLDGAGRFSAPGVFVREHGGPVREGEILPEVAVRYTGEVTGGSQMTFSVVLADAPALGPFTVALGAPAHVLKCL